MKSSSQKMLLLLLGCMVFVYKMVNLNSGFVDAKPLQNFSDFKIEKPKIIQTTYGETYECVNFYNQPAFSHQSKKNYLIHYKMHPKAFLTSSKTNNKRFGCLWKNGIGCPSGTVPIKKVTKDDILILDSFYETYIPRCSWNFTNNPSIGRNDQHHFAVSRTKEELGKFYTGASMDLSVHDPKVKFPQYSSSRMHVQIGDDFIQVGWTVNPKLYLDNNPRTFVYTKAGKNQCYNSMCPTGFISVRSDLPLGLVLKPVTIRGSGRNYWNSFSLLKDKANGNWYLKFHDQEIGYWPVNRFKQNFANKIEWGGEVYSAFMPSPQMGNGFFPVKQPFYDAFIKNITTVNEKYEIDDRVKNTEAFSDNTHGYKVIDDLHSQFRVKHMIHFGGPGNI